jgi:hypothetical protein
MATPIAPARGPRDSTYATFLARIWILGLCAFDDEDSAPLCAAYLTAYLASYRHAYAGHDGGPTSSSLSV